MYFQSRRRRQSFQRACHEASGTSEASCTLRVYHTPHTYTCIYIHAQFAHTYRHIHINEHSDPDANICMSQHVNWSSMPATRPAVTSDASYAVRVIAKDQRSSSLLKLRDLASRLHQMQSSEVDPKLGWWIFIFPLASSIIPKSRASGQLYGEIVHFPWLSKRIPS